MQVDIPPQIQRQIDEAEAYDKAIQDAADAVANPEGQTLEQPIEPAPAPPAPAPEPVAPAVKSEDESWRAKYLTLQGMFNAEVPRLQAQVKALVGQVAELQAKPQTPPPAPTASSITDKDVEAFGGDLLDVMKRQAADIVAQAEAKWSAERDALLGKISELSATSTSVREAQQASSQQQYFSALGAAVPDYEATNVDPAFLSWLGEVDPLSGLIRQEYLNNAFATLDVARTIALFTAWKPQAPAPATPPAKTEAQKRLERQTAPSGSKASTPPPSGDVSTRVWTGAEIDQFYTEVRQGLYRGKEAEASAIEAQIDAAAASGRVTS